MATTLNTPAVQKGIWSEAAGGFIETGLYRDEAVFAAMAALVDAGEDRDDLTVMEMCPDHEEQPLFGCEVCAADGADEPDGDDEDDQED